MNNQARTDAFTFYSLAMISYLESAVPNYVQNLIPFYAGDREVQNWLRQVWLQEEGQHGQLTKKYVFRRWPEFNWDGGYAVFLAHYRPRCDHHLLRPSPALEALARCVTETQTAMIYRCIGNYAPDPDLKALMAGMSKDEVRHYSYFRKIFHRYDAGEKNALWRKANTIVTRSDLVKEEDLALAYQPLNSCWNGPRPFPPLSYRQFLSVAGRVMSRYFPFEEAKRMLFRPLRCGHWLERIIVKLLAMAVRRQYTFRPVT
jgi:hypothetical protein